MTTVGERADSGGGRTGPNPVPAWRAAAIPTEHGGWSLTTEPAVLGLVVAWSWSGAALAGAALLAFIARTPLRVVLVDRHRHRWLERTRLAARILAIEVVLLAVLAGLAWWGTAHRFWPPLLVAAPLVAVELWYDMRSRSRRLVPELAGTIGIGSVAAVIALAGGAGSNVAIALWCVVSARAVAAIPYVRSQILRSTSRALPLWHSDVAQAVAIAVAAAGWWLGAVPGAALIAIATVAVANIIAVRLQPRRAVVIGVQQTIVGVLVIATTAIAVQA